MNDQNQQHAPQLIPQPSDLAGNDDLIQQINQGSEEPELNISEVNNQISEVNLRSKQSPK